MYKYPIALHCEISLIKIFVKTITYQNFKFNTSFFNKKLKSRKNCT